MGLTVIDLDIKNLSLEDFMRAMGYEPVDRNANLLIYESPYSTKGNIIVDTGINCWYDKEKPDKTYGGIYDLAHEITGSANRSELNLFIASAISNVPILSIAKRIIPMIIAMLIVYCLRGVSFAQVEGWVPQLISVAAVVVLHLWKHNNLLSIFGGTILYMVLVQAIF